MKHPLRIGLLVDSLEVEAWIYGAIEQVSRLETIDIVLIGYPTRTNEQDSQRPALRHLGYRLFDAIDRKVFRGSPDAFAPKNLQALLPETPTLPLLLRQQDGDVSFDEASIQRIQAYRPDILVHLGSGPLRGDILNSARWGVWAYYHGDPRTHRGGPPGFWETANDEQVTGVALLRLAEPPQAPLLLHRSRFPTYRFSPRMNRQLFLWTAATFLARKLARLQQIGPQAFYEEAQRSAPPLNLYDRPPEDIPGPLTTLKVALGLLGRILARKYDDLTTRPTWRLHYRLQEANAPIELHRLRALEAPPGRYWADPHILKRQGQYAIFFEDYERRSDKGRLAVITLGEDEHPTAPTVILEKPYHLSYPFVFEWEDRVYMIPESGANRTIDLYECTAFPHHWQFKMHLMQDVRAADATLFYHDHKWWLFVSLAVTPGISLNHELFLFFADTFATSDWTPHPLNPIVTDVRRARPAGRIFQQQGRIIRPSQNSAAGYGRSLNFNEIVTLSETAYEERLIDEIYPDWDERVIGVHTFQQLDAMVIIDALTRRRRFLAKLP